VAPASTDDAHRLLDQQHCLAASLSYVETRHVNNAYTIQFDNKIFQIARSDIQTGLRKAAVRVEVRLDDSIAVRFRHHYLTVTECAERPKAVLVPTSLRPPGRLPVRKVSGCKTSISPGPARTLDPHSPSPPAQSSFGGPGKPRPASANAIGSVRPFS
jgi:hypothetical protein